MGETRALAQFVADLRFEPLPASVVEQACRIIVDTVGCALSAWSVDPEKSQVAYDLAGLYPSAPGASVIGAADVSAQPAIAALANGMLANAADNDDTHKLALLHTGSVVVPTVLALAETERLSGRELIVALVAGYEVAVRVGMAVMPSHYRFWHSTGTNGTFGAAASAAKAFRLPHAETQAALGLAGTQAAGLNAFFESGDMTKSIHPGKAACNGILSGQLARLGATGPPTVLEHPKGYLNAYSAEPNLVALTAGLGSKWEILENGFKNYPSILASHSPIQATLALVNRHAIDPRRIARITNETYNTVATHFSNKEVASAMSARVSVPYCIAVSAVDRQLTQAQFAPARIRDPLVQEVLAKTVVIPDTQLTMLYPDNFPARVTITLTDGSSFQETVLFPKGDPQDPLSQADLDGKFHGNACPLLGRERAANLLSAIYALPEAASVDDVVSRMHP